MYTTLAPRRPIESQVPAIRRRPGAATRLTEQSRATPEERHWHTAMHFRFYDDGTVERRGSLWRRSLKRSRVLDVTFHDGRFRNNPLGREVTDAVIEGRSPLTDLYTGHTTVSVVTANWVETVTSKDDIDQFEELYALARQAKAQWL